MNFQEFCKTNANYRVQRTDDRDGHCFIVVDLLTSKSRHIHCFCFFFSVWLNYTRANFKCIDVKRNPAKIKLKTNKYLSI